MDDNQLMADILAFCTKEDKKANGAEEKMTLDELQRHSQIADIMTMKIQGNGRWATEHLNTNFAKVFFRFFKEPLFNKSVFKDIGE